MGKETDEAYSFLISEHCAKFAIQLLIAIIICIIPLLLNNSSQIVFHTSFPFYVTIVILFGYSLYAGYGSVLIGLIAFFIFNFVSGLPPEIIVINTLVNGIQIFLLCWFVRYIALRIGFRSDFENNESSMVIQQGRFSQETKKVNWYEKGKFYISRYNFILIFSGIVYSVFCITDQKLISIDNLMYVISGIIMFFTILKSIRNKDIRLILFMILVSIVPSLICAVLSVYFLSVPRDEVVLYVSTWVCSNFILLQTFGYIVYQILFLKIDAQVVAERRWVPGFVYRILFCKAVKSNPKETSPVSISVEKICYFGALMLWNIIIIFLFVFHTLKASPLIYLFPWMLGNILFGLNLFFYTPREVEKALKGKAGAGGTLEKFTWYEHRVIVVEKNTQTIITAISFLLPLGASLLKDVPPNLWYIFVADIFCACMAIGLIWVPSSNIKFISFLRTIKTIFYLYAICLLLISSIALAFCCKS